MSRTTSSSNLLINVVIVFTINLILANNLNNLDQIEMDKHLPAIISHPQSQIIPIGGKVVLFCKTNVPNAQLIWLYGQKRLKVAFDVQFEQNALILRHFATDPDSVGPGKYFCVLSTPQGSIMSRPAYISLPVLSSTSSIDQSSAARNDLIVDEHQSTVIECGRDLSTGGTVTISVPPAIPVFYTPQGSEILASNHGSAKYVLMPSGNLYIKDVQMSDTGPYKCGAYNPVLRKSVNSSVETWLSVVRTSAHGSGHLQALPPDLATASANVFANHQHQQQRKSLSTTLMSNGGRQSAQKMLVEPPSAVRVVAGSNLTLECAPSQIPGLIIWEKFGGKLPEDRSHYDRFLGILEINNVQVSDRGTYICKIYDHNNQEQSKSPLIMKRSLVEVELPPRFNNAHKMIKAKSDDDVELECTVDQGKPTPNISWLFNTIPISPASKPRFHLLPGNTLQLTRIDHRRHEGVYQCVAENIHGTDTLTYYVSVDNHRQPHRSISPDVKISPAATTVSEGNDLALECQTDTAQHVQWIRSSSQNTGRSNVLVEEGTKTLVIRNAMPSDSGMYTCVVRHPITGFTFNASALVRVRPSENGQGYNDEIRLISGVSPSSSPPPSSSASSSSLLLPNNIDAASDQLRRTAEAIPALEEEGTNRARHLPHQRPFSRDSNNHRGKKKMTIAALDKQHPPILVTLTEITELAEDADDSRSEPNVVLKWDILRGANLVDRFKVLYSMWPPGNDNSGVHSRDTYFELDSTIPAKARSYTLGNSFGDAKRYKFQIEAISRDGSRFKSNPMAFDNYHFIESPKSDDGSSRPVLDDVWEVPIKSPRNNTMAAGLKWRFELLKSSSGTQSPPPTGFRIYYRRQGLDRNYTVVNVPSAGKHSSHSYLLKDLQLDAKYEFKVCAYRGDRWTSKFSNPVFMSKTSRDQNAETIVWMQHDAAAAIPPSSAALGNHEIPDIFGEVAPPNSRRRTNDSSRAALLVVGGSAESSSFSTTTTTTARLVYSATAIIVASFVLFLVASITFCVYKRKRSFRKARNRRHQCNGTGYAGDPAIKNVRYLTPADEITDDLFISSVDGHCGRPNGTDDDDPNPPHQPGPLNCRRGRHKQPSSSIWSILCPIRRRPIPADSLCRVHPCYCGSTVSGHHPPSNTTTAPTSCWTSADEDPAAVFHDLQQHLNPASSNKQHQHLHHQTNRCCYLLPPPAGTNNNKFGTLASKTSMELQKSSQQPQCCFPHQSAANHRHQHTHINRCSLTRCGAGAAGAPSGYIEPAAAPVTGSKSSSNEWPSSSDAPLLLASQQTENFYHTLNCSSTMSPRNQQQNFCCHCVATMASVQRRHSRCCSSSSTNRCGSLMLGMAGIQQQTNNSNRFQSHQQPQATSSLLTTTGTNLVSFDDQHQHNHQQQQSPSCPNNGQDDCSNDNDGGLCGGGPERVQ